MEHHYPECIACDATVCIRRCRADALLSGIGRIFHFFVMASETQSSSLPPLVSEGGGLVCESVGKADLLLDHFDSKKSREAVGLPLTCHPSPRVLVLPPLPSGREIQASLVRLGPL